MLRRSLPRFDQSLESIILFHFRLPKLLQVVRETQAGAGAIEMMEKVHAVIAPTAAVARLSVLHQQTLRLVEAVDPAPGFRPPDDAAATAVESANIAVLRSVARVPAPCEVDRGSLDEEHHLRVGQMVMDEPRQDLPVPPCLIVDPVGKRRDDDAHRRTHEAVPVLVVPDVVRVARLVRGTAHVVAVAESVHVGTAKGGANRDVAEDASKRLQKIPANALPGFDGQFGVVRHVRNAVNLGDLRVQEIPHEVVLRQPLPAELIKRPQHWPVGLDCRTARAILDAVLAAFPVGKSRAGASPLLLCELLQLVGTFLRDAGVQLEISLIRLKVRLKCKRTTEGPGLAATRLAWSRPESWRTDSRPGGKLCRIRPDAATGCGQDARVPRSGPSILLIKELGVPVNRVTMILIGQRGVSANTALRLARYFGTPSQVWLNLQMTWERCRAEIEAGSAIAERVRPRQTVA